MAASRRLGKEDSGSRMALLRAAEALMREEGYAEVTSRKLARRAGLKPQLVHYYFRTMGDLFTALFRQATTQQLARVEEAAQADEPLVRLFEISCDPATAGLQLEFLALANHRKELHALIAEFGSVLNAREAEIIIGAVGDEGIARSGATAAELATIIQTAARGLAFAGKFNAERHAMARDRVLTWLRDLARGAGAQKTGS